MKTQYPNREFPLNELRIGDVVNAFDGPFGTAIVKNITENTVTFFRPYGTNSDVAYGDGLICYTGIETFSRGLPSEQTIFVYQRPNPE
jgi:hypothetical protein